MRLRISQFLWIGCVSFFALLLVSFQDLDRDGLDDDWETQFGFSTNAHASANLIGWWQLDTNAGVIALDRGTLNQPLKLKRNAMWITGGLFNAGVYLDGQGDFLKATNAPVYDLTNFTFSAWVKTSNHLKQTLVHWTDVDGFGWVLGTLDDGRLRAHVETPADATQNIKNNASSNFVNDNQWHHVALTYNRSNNLARIYLDGAMEAERNLNGRFKKRADTFDIGKRGSGDWWKGSIDEIRLYSMDLSPDEIPLLPNTFADPDGDGSSNLQEFQGGTDPLIADSDEDGLPDGADPSPTDFYNGVLPVISVTGGNFQTGLANTWLPQSLAVQLTTAGGQPLANAPITFAVTQGGGLIAASMQDLPAVSLALKTDAEGNASVVFLLPPIEGQMSLVQVAAVSGAQSVQTSFSVQTQATVAEPAFSPDAGTFDQVQQVIVTSTTPDAVIHYTTNGQDPTESDPTITSGSPVAVSQSLTLKARAFKTGWIHSPIRSADYVINLPTGPTFTTIAGGGQHSLAIDSEGKFWAWGYNALGQLAYGASPEHLLPIQNGLEGFTQLSAKRYQSTGLKNDGTVWAWGAYQGATIAPPSDFAFSATQIAGLSDVVSISFSAAVKSDGTLWTFQGAHSTPVQALSDVQAVVSGTDYYGSGTLALKTDGTVWAWLQGASPAQVAGLSDIVAISGGEWHAMALKSDGTVWAWGANTFGQLGNGTSDNGFYMFPPQYPPAQVPGLEGIVAIASGNDFNLALKNDGTLWAWGANASGQLGDGSSQNRSSPTQVHGLGNVGFFTDVASISAGATHALAIKTDGTLWAWGGNDKGQVGDGTKKNRTTPVQLFRLTMSDLEPHGGIYDSTIHVRVISNVPGSVVRYTTNGNDPTESDSLVPADGFIPLSSTTTLKVRAFKDDSAPSWPTTGIFYVGVDVDLDGMPNTWERNHGLDQLLNDADLDADGDGLTNHEEYLYGFNPQSQDSNSDGTSDHDQFFVGDDSFRIFYAVPLTQASSGQTLIIAETFANLRKRPDTRYFLSKYPDRLALPEVDHQILVNGQVVVTYQEDLPAGIDITDILPDEGVSHFQAVDFPPVYSYFLSDVWLVPLKLRMTVDVNRDGKIYFEGEDVDPALIDKTPLDKPFRFWVNDDNDWGEINGDDSPGQTSPPYQIIDEQAEADNFMLNGKGRVDGIRDLVDFFPLALNFGNTLDVLPPGPGIEYRLRHENEALNFVYTSLRVADSTKYLTQNFESGFGRELAQSPGGAETVRVSSSGTVLDETFLNIVKANNGEGVLLLEGGGTTDKPLFLEVWNGTRKLTETRLHFSLSNAKNMYRWVNLREKAGDTSGRRTNVDKPLNYPDEETNGKHFVYVHGYNVTTHEAEAGGAEMFKRLYQSGSKAMFTVLDWRGDQGSIPHPRIDPDYYENVKNAFATSPFAMIEINGLPGEKILTAHSLGNMVVSSAIKDHGLNVKAYFMLDAAVAIEAYDGTVRHPEMVHPDWAAPNYEERLWASEWHQLFGPERGFTDDGRYKLTWRNRFGPIANAYNFYSPGEDALRNGDGGLHSIFSAEYAFVNQEMLKGTAVAEAVTWDGHGGWGFNSFWDKAVYDSQGNVVDTRRRTPAEAASLIDEQLRGNSFFKRIRKDELYGDSGSSVAADSVVKALVLAECIPSRTFASGCNEIAIYNSLGGPQRNFNMMALRFGWPSERLNDSSLLMPDGTPRWLHSDWQEVAYFYTYPLFEKFVEIGKLNQ